MNAAATLVKETDYALADGEEAVRDYLKGAEGLARDSGTAAAFCREK